MQLDFLTKNTWPKVLFFILLISLDQLTKYLIRLWDGFYICNSGLAFGLPLASGAFLFVWTVIIFFIFLRLCQANSAWQKIGLLLLLGGAFSNALDRIYFGCVIDFINLPFWPVFNLADLLIVGGAILLVLVYWKKK